VLSLALHPEGYDWRFHPIDGDSFTDAGSTSCHDAPLEVPPLGPVLSPGEPASG
jgi:hypothetical protein